MIERADFYDDEEWDKIYNFSKTVDSPALIIDLDIIKKKYAELKDLFSYTKIYYAVKANPANEVIELLRDLGSNFDIASIYELDKLLALGIEPNRMSYGNTIKKEKDIEYAFNKGVRMFATDSKTDLQHIAKFAPGSKIFVRVLVEGSETADWPLSRKFGCHPDMAYDLIVDAKELGLDPYGISFHVGSQQRDIGQWNDALTKVRYLFSSLEEEEGITLRMINMGGGLPATYKNPCNELEVYSQEITRYLNEDFGPKLPDIIIEPGRYLVGNAGVLVSEIILISRKNNTALYRWMYLDVGKFNGLIETMDESIKYPIYTEVKGKPGEVVIAGPTCDSQDVMYENIKYKLPVNLTTGDRVYWFSTGAYTSSYCSVEFNGFPPLKTYILK